MPRARPHGVCEFNWWPREATHGFVYGDARLDDPRERHRDSDNAASRRYLPVPPRSNRSAVRVACLRQSCSYDDDDDAAFRLAATRSAIDRSHKSATGEHRDANCTHGTRLLLYPIGITNLIRTGINSAEVNRIQREFNYTSINQRLIY